MNQKLLHALRSSAAVVLLAGAPVIASAQLLTLNGPISNGPSVTVTGSGAIGVTTLELFVNGASAGHTQAIGDGTFSFTGVNVPDDAEVFVQNQESFYFSNNGNSEGWNDNSVGGAGGTVSVTGGNLVYTIGDPGQNPSLLSTFLGGGAGHNASTMRVLEFRVRNPGTTNLVWVSTNDGITGPPASNKACQIAAGSSWRTYLFPLVETGNSLPPSSTNFWIYLQFSGATAADVLEFDYIRVREYLDWHFDNDDTMGWAVQSGLGSGISVAGGKLSGPATGDGGGTPDRIIYTGPWTDVVDDAVLNVLQVANSSNQGTGGAIWGSQFTWSDNDGLFNSWNTVAGTPPGDGSTAIINHNLLTPLIPIDPGDWGANVNSNFLYMAGGLSNGGTFELDYIRLRPPTYYGPSTTVTALPVELDSFIID